MIKRMIIIMMMMIKMSVMKKPKKEIEIRKGIKKERHGKDNSHSLLD